MKHLMLNNNILAKDITDKIAVSNTGFEDTKELRFKELEIVLSPNSEVITEGDIVKVRSSSGEKIELPEGEFLVINTAEVIMVL